MNFFRSVSLLICIHVCSPASLGQVAIPSLHGVRPLGGGAGQVTEVEVRGSGLDGASAIVFDDLAATVSAIEASGDHVKARVRLPKDVAPGPSMFRVVTPTGITNAGVFVIGRPIPTVADDGKNRGFRSAQVVAAPSTVAGSLKDGDETHVYAVDMKAGRTLVAEAYSARGGSGMDPLVTIFSPEFRELAADDDLFGKDAAAWAYLPVSGRYYVQIQDANGRNPNGDVENRTTRDYLLTIGEVPLLVSAFPPGGRRGDVTRMTLLGVNLEDRRELPFAPSATAPLGDFPLRVVAARGETNALTVRLGDGPETTETDPEPGDDPLRATSAVVPGRDQRAAVGQGRGGRRLLHARAGRRRKSGRYAITAYAARIGSAADPVVAVVDPRGASVVEDDDALGRDARIERTIEPAGLVIAIRDHFGRGGPRFLYRVEVEPVPGHQFIATADLGGRMIPRDGAIAVPVALDRREEDGPVTILAGELPSGVHASPVTIPAKAKAGVLVLSASADAAIGPFPFRLVVRDVRGTVQVAYRERGRRRGPPKMGQDGKPEAADAEVPTDRPMIAVADRSALGIAFASDEIVAKPGESAEVKVLLDRRNDGAKKAVKLRWIGGLDDFEKVDDATVPADKTDYVFRLKAKAGASSRRVIVSAQGWFDGGSEATGVDAQGATLIVP